MAATEVLKSMPERLKASAVAVADAKTALNLRLAAHRDLIVEAIDGGMSHRQVATAAGYRAVGSVTKILANHGAEDDQ